MAAELDLAKFCFVIRLRDRTLLPTHTKGASLRGGFGKAFRRIACPLGARNCHKGGCEQPHTCLYGRIFETRRPPDAPVLRGLTHVPHPFVLEPPLTKRRKFEAGDRLSFQLVLIGSAIDYLPYFVFTFEELGRRGLGHPRARAPFLLEEIHLVEPDSESLIFTVHDRRIRYGGQRLSASKVMAWRREWSGSERLAIEFLTPARFKHRGEPTRTLNFRVLFGVLLGRVSTLFAFYGTGPLELDFKELLARSERVETECDELEYVYLSKPSARGRGKMPLGGFTGRIVFRGAPGEFDEFLPFLKLGEHLHAGSGTAFGQGQYRLDVT